MWFSDVFVITCYAIHNTQSRISSYGGVGGALKKIAPSGGRRENFGVFRVKNHDFTPKNHIFPILGGARETFGIFHVKNHDFTPKKSYFFQFYRPPPESAPAQLTISYNDSYLSTI